MRSAFSAPIRRRECRHMEPCTVGQEFPALNLVVVIMMPILNYWNSIQARKCPVQPHEKLKLGLMASECPNSLILNF